MPVAASILWQPIHAGAASAVPSFIFITQRALAAVQDHCAAMRTTCSGLLTGQLFLSPDTGEPYVVVESTIRLPMSPGDTAKGALVQGWVVAQSVLRATGEQLVGWYRGEGSDDESDAGQPTEESESDEVGLSLAEAEAHTALFPQPWQLALKVGPGRGGGGVFSPAAGGAWAQRCLSFYEVVDPSAISADGSTRTCLAWDNYRSDQAVVRAEPPAVAAPAAGPVVHEPAQPRATEPTAPMARRSPRQSPRVLLPDQFGDAIGPARHRPSNLFRAKRAAQVGAYGAVGLLALAGLFRLYSALASPSSSSARPPAVEVAAATPEARFDRAADTLALAVAAFDLRARLFASRQMQCPELARGLVLVEERWTSYNAARKDGGTTLDSARTARDRNLYADADEVERRFERSGCPRP
ncbi:MAG TPA: hypothetical protein VEU74_04455 [Gemmatimonadales bacterium]|nr:hypothetical protein [Gemmatimonadales bacterium]